MNIINFTITEEIKKWKKEAGATRPIMYNYKENTLDIYTSQPGYLIGRGGCLINRITSRLQEIYSDDLKITLNEVMYDII